MQARYVCALRSFLCPVHVIASPWVRQTCFVIRPFTLELMLDWLMGAPNCTPPPNLWLTIRSAEIASDALCLRFSASLPASAICNVEGPRKSEVLCEDGDKQDVEDQVTTTDLLPNSFYCTT